MVEVGGGCCLSDTKLIFELLFLFKDIETFIVYIIYYETETNFISQK